MLTQMLRRWDNNTHTLTHTHTQTQFSPFHYLSLPSSSEHTQKQQCEDPDRPVVTLNQSLMILLDTLAAAGHVTAIILDTI